MSVASLVTSIRFGLLLWISLSLVACGNGPADGGITNTDGSITVTMQLPAGQLSNSLALGQTATLHATVKDANNQAVSGVVVSFANEQSVAKLNPSTGKTLTNSSGVASIQISGLIISADTVVASANVNGKDITQSFSYGVSNPTFNLVNLQTGVNTLPVGGSTTISVDLVDPSNNNSMYPTPVAINFSSACSLSGKALLNSSVMSVISGGVNRASTTYSDQGCTGTDVIAVSLTIGTQTIQNTTSITIQQPNITVSMLLPSAQASNLLPLGQTGTIKAVVKDANNQAVSGAIVTFINDGSVGQLNPITGKTLTDSNGIATIQMTGLVVSADTLTASTTVNGIDISQNFIYGISTATFDLINLKTDVPTLSIGGSTAVSIEIVDPANSNAAYPTPVSVSFASNCTTTSKASLDAAVTSVISNIGGATKNIATANYRDQGCSGSDTITATLMIGAQTIQKSVNLTIQSAAATAVQFVSATPTSISLKGIGGGEQATVIFKVTDSLGNGIPNTLVNFLLNTTVGGITLSTPSTLSDANGAAQVVVNSGTVSTVVRVTAQLAANNTIQTQSNQLTISTGLPHQFGFSIAASTLNPEFYDRDNEEITLSVNASDRFGNPVPDNTSVSFYTEKGVGVITPSCLTVNGTCSVTLRSGGNRIGLVGLGRGKVLAVAVGEESFDDVNGDGWFSDGDILTTDLPEAYLDANESLAYNAGEQFIDFNNSGTYSGSDGKFNGKGCNASNCGTPNTINVFDEIEIIWSGSDVTPSWKDINDIAINSVVIPPDVSTNCSAGKSTQVIFAPTDQFGNVLPAGTTISFESSNGSITSDSSFTVPSTVKPTSYTLTIASDATYDSGICTNTVVTGALTVKVTLPKSGTILPFSIPVTD